MSNNEFGQASDGPRQQSPAGELTADSEQLLTEELDAIDNAMAGGLVADVKVADR